jgi:hypothetical protein
MAEFIGREEMQERVGAEEALVTHARTIRVEHNPNPDDGLSRYPRVFAITEAGERVELTTVVGIAWHFDVRGPAHSHAQITFANVELEANADPPLAFQLQAVEPTGSTSGFGCHISDGEDGSSAEIVEMPTYPITAETKALYLLRTTNRISLRDAARRLGLDVVQYSALERGQYTLLVTQWRLALELLARNGGA